jgi:hypothetical protein
VLGLTIAEGRHVLSAVNGMPAGDPLHTCVVDKLRGLKFPDESTPQSFTVSLNLGLGGK